jgi:hypothetical protein
MQGLYRYRSSSDKEIPCVVLSSTTIMSDEHTSTTGTFFKNLPPDLRFKDDPAQRRLLHEYGAVFVARDVVPPDRVVFIDEEDVSRFQARLDIAGSDIGGHFIELQRPAMDALLVAVSQARSSGLSITPRGPDSGRRNYTDTIDLWNSRVEPALVHWVQKGRMTLEQADAIRVMSPFEQLPEIFKLEADGIYFAKDLSKSIIYSVAPPGASQHLSLLAFDVAEFADGDVRAILAKHFWYRTVVSDLPHFTFLGAAERELSDLGLKCVDSAGQNFWVPDV